MSEVIQELTQFGFETTHGTAVAPTWIGYGVLTAKVDRSLNWGNSHTGTYLARRNATNGRIKPSFSWVEDATFEDLPQWLQMAVDGAVTPAADAGTPIAYTRVHDPDLATNTLKSVTMRWDPPGQAKETAGVVVNSIKLSGTPDNDQQSAWQLSAELMGLDVDNTSITHAALSERVTETISAPGTLFYTDDLPANIGTTQIEGRLIDWSIDINVNQHLKAFAENKRGYAPGKKGRGERTFDAQFTFEFDDEGEFTNFLSDEPVLRCIRLEAPGSIIHDTVEKMLTIDVVGYWSSFAFSNREGNKTAVVGLAAGYNATFANDYKITVVSALDVHP